MTEAGEIRNLLDGTPYAALAEAMEEYNLAKRDGFDGSLTAFIDMQRHQIQLDHCELQAERGLERLRGLQEYKLHDKICKAALEASLDAQEAYKRFVAEAG